MNGSRPNRSTALPPAGQGAALPRDLRRALWMLLVMLAVAALAQWGRPVHKLADQRPRLQLEQLVPTTFADWRVLKIGGVVLPDPQVLQNLERLYTQTLSRAYINRRGTVIMLSIAYGDDQRATMAVHYPEVCYPAQGFQVKSNRPGMLDSVHGRLPVRRLETSLSHQRAEPVTYWVTIGDRISLGGWDRRLVELEYGLQRVVPDGLLFRVSSINRDSAQAFRDHERFVADLMASLPPSSRTAIAGAAAHRVPAAAP